MTHILLEPAQIGNQGAGRFPVRELQGKGLRLPLVRQREAPAEDRAVGAHLPLQANQNSTMNTRCTSACGNDYDCPHGEAESRETEPIDPLPGRPLMMRDIGRAWRERPSAPAQLKEDGR